MPEDGEAASADEGPNAYDATDWEVRTWVDRVSVRLYRALHEEWGHLLIAFAVLLLVGQFALAGIIIVENPIVGAFVVLSVLPALVMAAWVYRTDVVREPLAPMAVTFALGGVLASVAALVDAVPSATVGSIPVVGMALFFLFFVGPVEEGVKWLAIRLHAYEEPSFQTAIDGAVYGAVAGLGFATVENAVYVVRGLLAAAEAGAPLLEATAATAVIRSLVGPGHVVFSGIAGYYLGLSKAVPEHAGPIAVKGLLIAALAHAGYNSAVTYLPGLLGLDALGVVLLILGYVGVVALGLAALLHRYRARHDFEAARSEQAASHQAG